MPEVYMNAPCKWAKVLPAQLDQGKYSKKYGGEWTIDLILDENSTLSASQLMNLGVEAEKIRVTLADGTSKKLSEATEDEAQEGEIYLRVRRKAKMGEDMVVQGPPCVVAKNGDSWDEEKEIGNGSLVRAHFDFYGEGVTQGFQLHNLQVLKHEEFVRGNVDKRKALAPYVEEEDSNPL